MTHHTTYPNPHHRSEMLVMARLITANEQYLSTKMLAKTYYIIGVLMVFITIPITTVMYVLPSPLVMLLTMVLCLITIVIWGMYFNANMHCHHLATRKEKALKAMEHLTESHHHTS